MTNLLNHRLKSTASRQKPWLASPTKGVQLLKLSSAVVLSAASLLGCAQGPMGTAPNAASQSAMNGMPMGGQMGTMAQMDEHMKAMRETHDKMLRAKSPQERSALMASNMNQMQNGMAMMGGMDHAAMGMTGMHGNTAMAGDLATRQQMMEKRMQMMQSMMQMMMDRMPTAPSQP